MKSKCNYQVQPLIYLRYQVTLLLLCFFCIHLLWIPFSDSEISEDNSPLSSLVGDGYNISTSSNREKWHEIPITVHDGKLIYVRTKTRDRKFWDASRARPIEIMKFDGLTQRSERDSLLTAKLENLGIQDFTIHAESVFFTTRERWKNKFYKLPLDTTGRPQEQTIEQWGNKEILFPALNRRGDQLAFCTKNEETGYDIYVVNRQIKLDKNGENLRDGFSSTMFNFNGHA